MKKGFKSMKIAMILMVMMLATTCVIGGTYAKYTTYDQHIEYARIAKFGVVVTANGTMFAKEYKSNDGGEHLSVTSVLSTDNVVAPGTSGEMVSMVVSGTPEVSIEVKFEAQLEFSNWKIHDKNGNEKFYCPIAITVGDEKIEGIKYINDAKGFAAAVKEAIEKVSEKYYVENFKGKNLSDANVIKVPKVSWEWAFDTGNDKYNDYDTQLGNSAAGVNTGEKSSTGPSTISLSIKTTVTQIN